VADSRYTLAHPLDEGNVYTEGGKAANAGDVVSLSDDAASILANAGYLNLDKDGKPARAAADTKADAKS
jgi:hypothetical protein